ncbi:hypothetical protein Tco_1085466, partial [Tanacetum coccineum]
DLNFLVPLYNNGPWALAQPALAHHRASDQPICVKVAWVDSNGITPATMMSNRGASTIIKTENEETVNEDVTFPTAVMINVITHGCLIARESLPGLKTCIQVHAGQAGHASAACQHLGTTTPSGTYLQALVMEIIVTFSMMFVTSDVATDSEVVRSSYLELIIIS